MAKINLDIGDTRRIISEGKHQGILRNALAYILATAYHETAFTMKPVTEYGSLAYLQGKKYWPYIGRGYVQLTWKRNYQLAKDKTGIDFVAKPDLAKNPAFATVVLVQGMKEGWFTGKKLDDYFTLSTSDYVHARKMINPKDYKTYAKIAGYAEQYEKLLTAEGYGVEEPKGV